MKKIISLFLALCMLAGCLSLSAFAEATDKPEAQEASPVASQDVAPDGKEADETVTLNYSEMGLTLKLPEAFTATKGILEPYVMGELAPGLNLLVFFYIGMDQDEYAALDESSELTEEEFNAMQAAMGIIAYVFAVDGGRTADDLIKTVGIPNVTEKDFTEVGKAGDVTFYLFLDKETDEKNLAGLAPAFAEEYTALQSRMPELMKSAEFSVPVSPGSELVGRVLRFETRDVDGKPVKSEDIFSQHEITLVNVWATWCGPCRSELEELGEIDRRLAAKDCAVLGICIDADEAKDEAKAMISQYRLDYLNIQAFDDLDDALAIEGYPTTVFVGRDGAILAPPVIGVPNQLSFYEETIDSLLAVGESAEGQQP